jgi:hypothetical protein
MGPYSYAFVHDGRLRNSLTVLGREINPEDPRTSSTIPLRRCGSHAQFIEPYPAVTGLNDLVRILRFRKKGGEFYGRNCSNKDR